MKEIPVRYQVKQVQLLVLVSKFHELRYNVAYMLKEKEDSEKRKLSD